jgi:hypothetical protein
MGRVQPNKLARPPQSYAVHGEQVSGITTGLRTYPASATAAATGLQLRAPAPEFSRQERVPGRRASAEPEPEQAVA